MNFSLFLINMDSDSNTRHLQSLVSYVTGKCVRNFLTTRVESPDLFKESDLVIISYLTDGNSSFLLLLIDRLHILILCWFEELKMVDKSQQLAKSTKFQLYHAYLACLLCKYLATNDLKVFQECSETVYSDQASEVVPLDLMESYRRVIRKKVSNFSPLFLPLIDI